MSELRQKFESLPEVTDSLSCHIRIGSDGLYYTSLVNFEKLTAWLNGAWYAFQEQQAKIDELEKELSTTKQVLHNVIDMERAKKIELEKKINANKEKISYALKHNGRCNETTIRVLEGILNDQYN